MKIYRPLLALILFSAIAPLQANAGPNRVEFQIQPSSYQDQEAPTLVDNGGTVGEVKIPTAHTEQASLTGGGVYISGGVLLVVILLLIILL